MSNPYISIVMPVYNCQRYLHQSIGSVLGQTFADIELVCVDDCSTDSSLAIIKKYINSDERVKMVRHDENLGEMPSRSDGVMAAGGQYVMFLDSDDELAYDACEKLYNITQQQQADIYGFGTQVCCSDEQTRLDVQNYFTSYSGWLYERDILQKSFVEHGFTRNIWDKMYDAHLCKKAFNMITEDYRGQKWFTMAEDSLAFLYIAYYAKSFYGANEVLYKYYYGRGVMHSELLTLDHFRKYCTLAITAGRINEFFTKREKSAQFRDVADAFHAEQLNCCLNVLKNQISDNEFTLAAEILNSSWSASGSHDILLNIIAGLKDENTVLKEKVNHLETVKSWEINFPLLPYGERVILYGAGDVGQDYYRQITQSGYCEIALWVDKNHISLKNKGLPVSAPEEMIKTNFSCVLIAVQDCRIANEITQELLMLGVPEDKIKRQEPSIFTA